MILVEVFRHFTDVASNETLFPNIWRLMYIGPGTF